MMGAATASSSSANGGGGGSSTLKAHPASFTSSSGRSSGWSGLRAALGSPPTSLALYRIALGTVLLAELSLRFRYLRPFYTDGGTLPLRLLDGTIDPLYRAICLHCRSGSLSYQRSLLGVQCIAAFCLIIGYRTRLSAALSWFLYLSLTLRNTWLAFILDRYFHFLTFYAMLLPCGEVWSVDSMLARRRRRHRRQSGGAERGGGSSAAAPPSSSGGNETIVATVATVALKLQICWIYLDAGYGKLADPLGGWSLGADPLPALDTYARHTVAARYMYGILKPAGLRLLTPTVVWVELGAAPLALLGSWMGRRGWVWCAVGTVWALHLGIAATIRNTVLLSLVANCAWFVFLPPLPPENASSGRGGEEEESGKRAGLVVASQLPSFLLISAFVCGSVWFETLSNECNQSMKHIWSTLLHNRWNVFVGAEEYVTWEIAPGRLQDGTIVDVWAQTDYVDWDMPGSGVPCTSTARGGRWRSFPYLADLEGEAGYVLWQFLCDEWNERNGVPLGDDGESGGGGGGADRNSTSGRRLLRYNFFMLQADVLPDMGFSSTRKRLIHSHDCAAGFIGDGSVGDDDEAEESPAGERTEL